MKTADPQKPALVCEETTVTFAESRRRAGLLARRLVALGVRPGDRVAVMSHNSIESLLVSAALRKARMVCVPVNYRLRDHELAYIVRDSGAAAVCAGPGFVEHVEAAKRHMGDEPILIALKGARAPRGWVDLEADLERAESVELREGPAYHPMPYTSGTTGFPKGVYRPPGLQHTAMTQLYDTFGLRESDVHLMAGAGYHSAVGLFCGLTTAIGGTVVVMPRFNPQLALALIERHRVTTTFMPPTLLQRIMDLPAAVRSRYDVSSLRVLILGGAPCPYSLKQRAVPYFGDVLWEFYGATETGVNLVLRPEDQLRKPGSAGRPVEGHDIRLLDDAGNPVPDGEPGELWIRNQWLASYFNQPEATRKSMRDGFFSVGDVAYRDSEGYYYICDRKVDMIISGGVNIYPAEIEACLHSHPAVQEVAVIGVPDELWGESVKALVVLHSGAAATEQELIRWCRKRIADYKQPRSIEFVGHLLRDQAGKLLKRKIRARYWEKAGRLI